VKVAEESYELSDRLITIRQAASALGQSVSTVRALISRKDLPAVKLGRSVRIRQSDLEEFIKQLPLR
jgi:excisionase family DNA binding protein